MPEIFNKCYPPSTLETGETLIYCETVSPVFLGGSVLLVLLAFVLGLIIGFPSND